MFFLSKHRHRFRIANSIFTNSTGILFSRITGFVRDFATASILGANIYSDIFFVAFKLPNLFRNIFAEGAFTQAFLPSLTAAKYKGAFCKEIFIKLFGAILLLSLFVTFFSELITKAVAWGFDEETCKIAAPFVALNFWYLDIFFLAVFLMALLHYRKHFAVPAFSAALLNISMIIALFLARDQGEKEIVWYLSCAVIAGGIAQVLAHIAALKKKRITPMLVGGFRKKRDNKTDCDRFYKAFIPATFGASGNHIASFIDTILASFLAVGSISYLYYANRVFQLPLALFAIAVSMAVFPTIAKAIKRGDESGAIALLGGQFRVLTLLLALSAIGGILLSDGIIWLLFERQAFARTDTIETAHALVAYMVGLIPFGLSRLLSLWLYANHRQVEAAKNTAIALGANALFSLALISPLGVVGLALSGSLSGVILLALNIRSFGWQRVFCMIRASYLLFLLGAMILAAAAIEAFKFFINYRGFFG
ncbi:putative lipid II flippase MurJ [Campylobacterota bacterium]|nr:putative lipid II flippase MurJ [Campylobacterota bacterium]